MNHPYPEGETFPSQDALGCRIRYDLATRGLAGLWAHLVGVAFLLILSGDDVERWTFRLPGAVVLVTLTLLRGAWATIGIRYTASLQTWLRLYCPLLTATGFTWGLLWGGELIRLGWHSWQSGVEMSIIVAIGMGGLIAVAPVLRCQLTYQTGIWAPVFLCCMWAGPQYYMMAALALICFAFVSVNAFKYHREYRATLRREFDLEGARRQAEVASQAKSSFVANISHELRTPLHGILGMLDLSLNGEMPAGQRGMVEMARNSADSLLHLVNDILDFSKIEAGRMEAERIPFSPAALALEVTQLLAVRARQKGIALEMEIAPQVPPAVLGDPTRLRQILVNLTGNAVKFTAQGSVTISLQRADDRLRWSVRDTGIGVPASQHAMIFEAFAQADGATTRQFGGTGLGLALSQRLALLLGGEITVSSAPGAGSTFSLDLPCAATDLQVLSRPEDAPGAVQTPPLHILLVEDNVVNQRVASGILEAAGHRVTLAVNGRAALERLAAARFDLILMDLQMPEMGGDEATRRIRQSEAGGPRTPIIGLSANAGRADRQRCLEIGMDDYLTKPFRRNELLQIIEQTHSLRDRTAA